MFNYIVVHRFYWLFSSLEGVGHLEINDKVHASLFHQLTSVLRIKSGNEVCFFEAGSSNDFIYSLAKVEKHSLSFTYQDKQKSVSEHPFQLILAQAIPQKSEKWEWILQKGTELGVQQFIPLITERTQRNQLPRHDRMQRIIIEAVEQSGRTTIPVISEPKVLSQWALSGTSFVASLHSGQKLLGQLQTISNLKSLTIIIGPEGGLTQEEEDSLITQHAYLYSLGTTVLRLETAAIVSLGIVGQI